MTGEKKIGDIVIDGLVQDLFSGTWVPIRDYRTLPDCKYPGVYLLAYTDENLIGQQVRTQDIYYVGVTQSCGGVRQRLYQFLCGLEKPVAHSAAMRFLSEVAAGTPYSQLAEKRQFFVTSVSVECQPRKTLRTPVDLQKCGIVAALEWYALARVKEETGGEPFLNKK
ncbi:MAG TPA: hypothetical protein VHF01_13510 [Candidatus Acidoferrum sp.]|nr:hypothetical protein [Candidatus Acidoferrum sp.]